MVLEQIKYSNIPVISTTTCITFNVDLKCVIYNEGWPFAANTLALYSVLTTKQHWISILLNQDFVSSLLENIDINRQFRQ